MIVPGAGGADQGGCASVAEAAADGDLDAAVGLADQLREVSGALKDGGGAAGGEDAAAASADDVLERFRERGRGVEGAMEGDFKRGGEGDELAGALDVDATVREEDAEGKATDAELSAVEKIFAEQAELEV